MAVNQNVERVIPCVPCQKTKLPVFRIIRPKSYFTRCHNGNKKEKLSLCCVALRCNGVFWKGLKVKVFFTS